MILIDLVAEERCKLVRLLRRSLAARLGVRDRAEARAVGKRGKDFVLVRWAEGVWGVSGPKRRDVLRPGPMEIRAVLVAARTITFRILLTIRSRMDGAYRHMPYIAASAMAYHGGVAAAARNERTFRDTSFINGALQQKMKPKTIARAGLLRRNTPEKSV